MDGASIDPVATPSSEKLFEEATSEPIDLLLHKQKFIDAARSIDPLKPLRRHPLLTVAAAAVLGVVAASPAVARSAGPATKATLLRQFARFARANVGQLVVLSRAAINAARKPVPAVPEPPVESQSSA